METIHTLQDYMLHTESITYIIIVAALIGITFFYRFLTDRDDDEKWLRMNIEHRTSNIECWMRKKANRRINPNAAELLYRRVGIAHQQ